MTSWNTSNAFISVRAISKSSFSFDLWSRVLDVFKYKLSNLHRNYYTIVCCCCLVSKGRSDMIQDPNQWLALGKNNYTLEGSECYKIGVSYKAFRFQDDPCLQKFQSCCGKQLKIYAEVCPSHFTSLSGPPAYIRLFNQGDPMVFVTFWRRCRFGWGLWGITPNLFPCSISPTCCILH